MPIFWLAFRQDHFCEMPDVSRDDSGAETGRHLSEILRTSYRLPASAATRGDDPHALGHRALLRGNFAEAASALEQAAAADRENAAVHAMLGIALLNCGQNDQARGALQRAIALDSLDFAAQYYSGVALAQSALDRQAIACLQRAIELNPAFAPAHAHLARELLVLGRIEECDASARRALELEPEREDYRNLLIFAMDLKAGATTGEQQRERRAWNAVHAARLSRSPGGFANRPDPHRKLRVGYVSPDFRRHAVGLVCGPILWHHDPSAFDVYGYYGRSVEDPMTRRIRAACREWRHTATLSDDALERQIRSDSVDILVDLSGHTKEHRLPVFARKPAPIQVTGWGSVNGTGMPAMDFLFSDPIVVPDAERALFAERVADLPCALCLEPPAESPPVEGRPSMRGEPFTFGCLNRTEKMSENVFAAWARILHGKPGSRLLLQSFSLGRPAVKDEVLARFERHGIEGGRLVLMGAMDLRDHMGTFGRVDLALDPFPHNGGVTTLETLWMGVPVVALRGTTPTGRLGESILTAVGMKDWIASDEDEYVRIALEFADDAGFLARLRADMRKRLSESPVYDARAYVRAVEASYRRMWQEWCQALR